MQLGQTGASFIYQSTNGVTLDSGVIPYGHPSLASQGAFLSKA
jgi:hypothetical protein